MQYVDTLLLHSSWFVARNLDAFMLALWWMIAATTLVSFLIARVLSGPAWRLKWAFVSFGFLPFFVLLCVALVTPLAARAYSWGGFLLALVYVFVGVGFFHSMSIALSMVWALRGARLSLRKNSVLLVLVLLNVIGAAWMRDVAREYHSGPFFQTGG